jgi:plastocyanin
MRLLITLIASLTAIAAISETRVVNVGDFYFQDQVSLTAQTRINVGDSVKWQWIGGNHTTTEVGKLWNAPINSLSTTYERVFDKPGLWEYFCVFHHQVMRGTVRVDGVLTTVQPAAVEVNPGRVVSGGLPEILHSDNQRLIARPGPVFTTSTHPINVRVVGFVPPGTGENLLSFRVEGHASSTSIVMRIRLYNPFKAEWVTLAQDYLPTSDIAVEVIVNDPENYITPATGTTQAEGTFRAVGPVFTYPWEARIDHIEWIAQ